MRHPLAFVCFEKWWRKLALQSWLLLRKICWSHCWLITVCSALHWGGCWGEEGRPLLPTSIPNLRNGKHCIKSFPDTDEGTNLQQPNVVHHCVGCQTLPEVPPSGVEHQLWLQILLMVLDDWHHYIFGGKAKNNEIISSYNCTHTIKTNRLFPFFSGGNRAQLYSQNPEAQSQRGQCQEWCISRNK